MTIDDGAGADGGVVMQVNKYVPHYQRLPSKVDKKDFKIFTYEPNSEAEQERYDKVRPHIEAFDRVLIDSLMVDRAKKYNVMFKGANWEDEDSVHEGRGQKSHTKRGTETKQRPDDYDSDEERDNAHSMFVQDISNLREYFIGVIDHQVKTMEEMQTNFNSERQFYLEST